MDYTLLGRRIRDARKKKGWTQAELAKKIGRSTSFLGHIERGTRKASMDSVLNIAQVLGISMDALFGINVAYKHPIHWAHIRELLEKALEIIEAQ